MVWNGELEVDVTKVRDTKETKICGIFFFFETVSFSLSWPQTCYVTQDDLELLTSCLYIPRDFRPLPLY